MLTFPRFVVVRQKLRHLEANRKAAWDAYMAAGVALNRAQKAWQAVGYAEGSASFDEEYAQEQNAKAQIALLKADKAIESFLRKYPEIAPEHRFI